MTDDQEPAAPAQGWKNTRIPEFIRRYSNCLGELIDAREALKDLAKEADAEGLNPRALKRAVMLLADESGKRKLREEEDLANLLEYMRDAGEPLEIETPGLGDDG